MFLLEQNDVLENRSSDVDALSLSVSDAYGLHDRERRKLKSEREGHCRSWTDGLLSKRSAQRLFVYFTNILLINPPKLVESKRRQDQCIIIIIIRK